MKIKMMAALAIATVATLPLAAIANACGGGGDIPAHTEFVTPSGNIVCSYYSDSSGVACEIRDHTWAMPTSTHGPDGRACDFNFGGLEIYLSQAKEARLGCYEGASTFNRPGLTQLDYGQTISRGAITCASEVSGVACNDTATGHYFRVSREDYELG